MTMMNSVSWYSNRVPRVQAALLLLLLLPASSYSSAPDPPLLASPATSPLSTTPPPGDVDDEIVLLPPYPDEQPPQCDVGSNPLSPCGPDRYCELREWVEGREGLLEVEGDGDGDGDGEQQTTEPPPPRRRCLHKSLLGNSPSTRDGLFLLLAISCCAIAATAGIGGGGLMLPLIVTVLNFTAKEASGLSDAAVFGNCLGQTLFNALSFLMSSRDRGGIGDGRGGGGEVSAAVMVILPGLLAGGALAVALESSVPSSAVLLLALFTLSLAAVKTHKKARQLWKKERSATVIGPGDEERVGYFSLEDEESDAESREEGVVSVRDPPRRKCARLCSQYYIELLIASCWALDATTFLAVLGLPGITILKCTPMYWALLLLPVAIGGGFLWRGREELKRRRGRAENERGYGDADGAGAPLLEGAPAVVGSANGTTRDDRDAAAASSFFDPLALYIPPYSFLVGVLSALLGIGGGELVGPLLLALGMNPRLSTSATAVISLLNSAINLMHILLARKLVSSAYAAVLFFAGLCGGGGGRMAAVFVSKSGGGDPSSPTDCSLYWCWQQDSWRTIC